MQTGLVCVPPWPSMCAGSDVRLLARLLLKAEPFANVPPSGTRADPYGSLPSFPPATAKRILDWLVAYTTARVGDLIKAKDVKREDVVTAISAVFGGKGALPWPNGYELDLPDLGKMTAFSRRR